MDDATKDKFKEEFGPDLRNFEMHKVHEGKITEFAGVEVRIV